jgi:hypothetical protein
VSWFAHARFSPSRRDRSLNYFGVDASQPLSVWPGKGWIHRDDPRGWFQWYCRYYMGRRIPEEDARQIERCSPSDDTSHRSSSAAQVFRSTSKVCCGKEEPSAKPLSTPPRSCYISLPLKHPECRAWLHERAWLKIAYII